MPPENIGYQDGTARAAGAAPVSGQTPRPDFDGALEGAVPDGPVFPGGEGFSLEQVLGKYAGQVMTPELLQQFAADIAMLELAGQFQEMDYKDSYLEYLEKELGLNSAQLDLAAKQVEFQQGPYWDWYTGPYFEFMQQDSENKAEISDNQVLMSESNAEASRFGARSSQFNSLGNFYNAAGAAYSLQERMAQDPRNIRQSQINFGAPVGQSPNFGY